jgi:hypothetical protein
MYRLVTEGAHFGFVASESKVNGAYHSYLLAGMYASAAEYTFVVVAVEGRVALIHRKYSCAPPQLREVFLFYAQILCNFLQLTL